MPTIERLWIPFWDHGILAAHLAGPGGSWKAGSPEPIPSLLHSFAPFFSTQSLGLSIPDLPSEPLVFAMVLEGFWPRAIGFKRPSGFGCGLQNRRAGSQGQIISPLEQIMPTLEQIMLTLEHIMLPLELIMPTPEQIMLTFEHIVLKCLKP